MASSLQQPLNEEDDLVEMAVPDEEIEQDWADHEEERLLEEFKEIKDNKIGTKYLDKIAKKDHLTEEKIEEIKVIANRPRLDPEVWGEIKEGSSKKEIQEEVDVMQGRWYDPFAGAMEIVQIEEERRMGKIEEIEEKKVKKEIMRSSQVAVCVGVLLAAVQIAQKGEIDFFQILAMIALVQIAQFCKMSVQIQTKALAQHKGVRQEMVRSRTQIAGNVIERLMQICDKITFVERRLMEMNGSYAEFYRQLQQHVLAVHWRKPEMGEIALKDQIARFLAGKFRLGVRSFPGEFVTQFIQQMQKELRWAAKHAETPKEQQFWLQQIHSIPTQIREMIENLEMTVLQV